MKTTILKFNTILDLIDFFSLIEHNCKYVDYSRLTIKGTFEEADIVLAKAGYKAHIADEKR